MYVTMYLVFVHCYIIKHKYFYIYTACHSLLDQYAHSTTLTSDSLISQHLQDVCMYVCLFMTLVTIGGSTYTYVWLTQHNKERGNFAGGRALEALGAGGDNGPAYTH